jgi:hypothetical protein
MKTLTPSTLTAAGSTLSLKGYKTVSWMSEETVCFTATVLIDGKPVGEAENDGHGGCTFVRFVSPAAEALAEKIAKDAKPADYGWEFCQTLTFDNLVDILVQKIDVQKQEEKIVKKVRTKAAKEMHYVTVDCKKAEYFAFKKALAAGSPAARLTEIAKAKVGFKAFVIDLTDAEILAHFAS